MDYSPEIITDLKWLKNKKNTLGLIFAIGQVLPAEAAYDLLKDTESYLKKWNLNKTSSVDKWLSFYSDPQILFDYYPNRLKQVQKAMESDKVLKTFILSLLGILQPFANIIKNDINEFYPLLDSEYIMDMLDRWANMEFDLPNISTGDRCTTDLNRAPDQDVFLHFLLRVGIPCFYFYGETHYTLFEKAKNGDVDSICKLFKLDKSLICERSIAETYYQASTDIESATFKKLNLSLGTNKKITSRKSFKSMIAGCVSHASKSFGECLTSSQLQDLFDSAAKLKDRTVLQDQDIESPEAFAKSIQRKSHLYKNLFNLDKN